MPGTSPTLSAVEGFLRDPVHAVAAIVAVFSLIAYVLVRLVVRNPTREFLKRADGVLETELDAASAELMVLRRTVEEKEALVRALLWANGELEARNRALEKRLSFHDEQFKRRIDAIATKLEKK